MMRTAGLTALTLSFALGAFAAEELPDPPLSISGFGLTRMRKTVESSNVVTASFEINAVPGAEFGELEAKIKYVDFEGEAVAKPNTAKVGDLEGGDTKAASVAVGFVPQFNGYVVTLTGLLNGEPGEWEFFGASGVDQPTYLPKKPIPRSVILVVVAQELRQAPRARSAKLYLRVRNIGAVSAYKATCAVSVIGRGGRKAGTAKATLKGAKGGRKGIVAGGEERLFIIGFRSFPVYESYDVSIDWKSPPTEERLSGGEFEGNEEVELAHFKFERKGDDVIIRGDARNGLANTINNLRISLTMLDGRRFVGTAKALLAGPTRPGKVRPFRAVAKRVSDYTDFDYEVAFEESGGGPGPVAAGDAVVTIGKAIHKPDGTAEITGDVTNAGTTAIKNIDIIFSFRKVVGGKQRIVRRVTHKVPGVLKPRATSKFKVIAKKVPAFDEYLYEVSYKPGGPK
jgi:hypothetical protein